MTLLWSLLSGLVLVATPAFTETLDVPTDAISKHRAADLPVALFPLMSEWRFRSGHSEAWAARDFDDSSWTGLDSLGTELGQTTREHINWAGEGWFRLRLHIDPELSVNNIGLVFGHHGAMAVYLDGQLLVESGRPASRESEEEAYYVHGVKEMVPVSLLPGAEHVLAVHFSNRRTLAMFDAPSEPGFSTALVDKAEWAPLARRFAYSHVQHQTLFAVPLAFGIFHLLLFLYHRQRPGHLYYALFALSVAVMIYAPLHVTFAHTPRDVTLLRLVFKWSLLSVAMSSLLFLYTEFLGGVSRVFKWACLFGAGVGCLAIILPLNIIYYVTVMFLMDVVRIVLFRLRGDIPGARVVRAGWFLFAGGCLLQVLMELGLITGPLNDRDAFQFFPYIYGTLILVVSMSVYLARAVGRTNRELATQLQQVQELSEQAVEHEREVQSAKLATLTHLMAGIVHEMNSPVGAIHSARDTLSRAMGKLRSSLPQGAAAQAIDGANATIESATDRLGTILSGFKAFSHLDEAEWQVASVEAGLDSTLTIMQSQLGSRIEVQREYGGVPAIWCAPARLNQVFMHLITNALTSMDGSGTIRLRTWVETDQVWISISDSGTGIAAENLDGLFDIGFRRSARVKMGMGLVSDSHTIDEHGGRMHVQSEVSVGTEVSMQLPRRLRE